MNIPISKLYAEAKRLGISNKLPVNKLREAVTAALAAEKAPVEKPAKTKKVEAASEPKKVKKASLQEEPDDLEEQIQQRVKAVKKSSDSKVDPVDLLQAHTAARFDELEAKIERLEKQFKALVKTNPKLAKLEEPDEETEEAAEPLHKSIREFFEEDPKSPGGFNLVIDSAQILKLTPNQMKLIIKAVSGKETEATQIGALRGELSLLLQTASTQEIERVRYKAGQEVIYAHKPDDLYQAWIASPKVHGTPSDPTLIRILFDDKSTDDVPASKVSAA